MDKSVNTYSPLVLAYIGDAVYEIYVREHIVKEGNRRVNDLNKEARAFVSAKGQSKALEILTPMFTEEESEIFRRGRNANSQTMSKHASVSEYRHATGLEAVMGYLHLLGRHERIRELMQAIFENEE